MSYSRGPSVGYFVLNQINSYVYSDGEHIHDYASTKSDLIEMLYRRYKTDDVVFKDWLLRRLAKELSVPVREIPLTDEEWSEQYQELQESYREEK